MATTSPSDAQDPIEARLIVTPTSFESGREARAALRRVLPDARRRDTGFRGVYELKVEGDPVEVARTLTRECGDLLGHITPVLAEVESRVEEVGTAAAQIAANLIGPAETFAFRLKKRGSHWLRADTPELERTIGQAIWEALEDEHGSPPEVDLSDPDVTIRAEVLGPITVLGIARGAWEPSSSDDTQGASDAG